MTGPKPRIYLTVARQIRRGIWPWNEGLRARLPEHYKQHYMKEQNTQPLPVHWVPSTERFRITEKRKEKIPVQNVPIPVIYPKACDEGLWGGEGIVQGYTKWRNKHLSPRIPKFWHPKLISHVLYSEILDRWMTVTVTNRTLDMIDDAYGFDFYILKTAQIDMRSKLGMDLKREMLLTLARKSMYPNDPAKRDKIYKKYEKYTIPEEEAEWIGLSLSEAAMKQQAIEDENAKAATRPLKDLYKLKLLQNLEENPNMMKDMDEGESESWLSRINPFVRVEEEKK